MSEQTCATCMFGAGSPDGRGTCYWPYHADGDYNDMAWDAPSFDNMERKLDGSGERVSDRFDCKTCPSFELRPPAPEAEPEPRCPDTAEMFDAQDDVRLKAEHREEDLNA